MKVTKKILIIITTVILINVSLFMSRLSNEEAATAINFSIVTQPYIDVVLAKSKTETDLSTFKTDLLNSLKSKGVKTENDWVRVTAIESYELNIQDAFDWKKDVSSLIGNITITDGGKNVEMVGNTTNPGKNAIWIIPEKDMTQEFTFDYKIAYGDSFNAAGMLLRVKEENGELTGYMLSFNNSTTGPGDTPWSIESNGKSGAIWKFTYRLNSNGGNISKELIKAIDINVSGTLTVRASKTAIEVSGGGLSGTEICEIDDQKGAGFGFFSEHYSHNCEQIR